MPKQHVGHPQKLLRQKRFDGAAGEDGVGVVEDGGLAGSYGALGRVEIDAGGIFAEGHDGGGAGLVAVADFDVGAEGGGEAARVEGDPVDVADEAGGVPEVAIVADDELVLGLVEGDDVERTAGGDAEAAALSDGVAMEPLMRTEDFAIESDDFAGGGRRFPALLAEITFDELNVIAGRHEANFLAFGLFGDGQLGGAGNGADFVFGEVAEGEINAGELILLEAEEEVGLIFGGVTGAEEFVAAGGGIVLDAGVVSGGEAGRSSLAHHVEKLIKLDLIIAGGAWDGRAAVEVVFDEWSDDGSFELAFEIDDVKRKLEMGGDAAGVVDVVDGAAPVWGGCAGAVGAGAAGEFGEAAVIPELHGEADDWEAALLEDGGDGGAVDAAGHGDGNGRYGRDGACGSCLRWSDPRRDSVGGAHAILDSTRAGAE